MKLNKLLFTFLIILICSLHGQQTIQIMDLTIEKREFQLLNLKIQILNTSQKPIAEIGGYFEILDKTNDVAEKKFIFVVNKHDIPLEPDNFVNRNVIIKEKPGLTGNIRFRVTRLRFYQEQTIYMICPNCGDLILTD